MSIKPDNRIKLRDGRTIGYAEYGDPSGRTVLHFHGYPSSRHETCRPSMDQIATRLNARVIVVERPGFGLSTFKRHRTILDWPDDVSELADYLNLEQFAVMGLSGGSPYVAACAMKIPHRLIRAGIISGVSPLDVPGAFDGMNKSDRQAYQLAKSTSWLLRPTYWWVASDIRRNPVKFFSQYAKELSETDQAAFSQEEVMQMFIQMAQEAFRSGAHGVAWDSTLIVRPWGFSPRDINIPVYHWQGEADRVVTPSQGRYWAQSIPNCQSRFLPNEGHISLISNYYEQILSAMIC